MYFKNQNIYSDIYDLTLENIKKTNGAFSYSKKLFLKNAAQAWLTMDFIDGARRHKLNIYVYCILSKIKSAFKVKK